MNSPLHVNKEMSNKTRKKLYQQRYRRDQGSFHPNRYYNFINFHNIHGNSAGSSQYAFTNQNNRYQLRRRDFGYYRGYRWQQPQDPPLKKRDVSPPNGSEEHTLKKIQETSDMIKRQLMSPDNDLIIASASKPYSEPKSKSLKPIKKLNRSIRDPSKRLKEQRKTALREKFKKSVSTQKYSSDYNVKEIHNQIMNHISKLNYGKKQNLINADNTGYDEAIQQIYKQKSLELSKALREMSHQEKPEASAIVNSIIPDFAIKFQDLPIDVIRALSSSFETFEKNIGAVDENSTYDLESQCMLDSTNQSQHTNTSTEYQHCEKFNYTYDDNHTGLSNSQVFSQQRVLILNSEDAESIVIKNEDLLGSDIKIEPSDSIEVVDSEDDLDGCSKIVEGSGPYSTSEDYNSILKLKEEKEWCAPPSSNLTVPPLCSNIEALTTASSTNNHPMTAAYQNASAIPGSLRVSTNLFEKSNGQNSSKQGNQYETVGTSSCSIDSVPRIRINTNIFDKIGSFLSETPLYDSTEKSNKKEYKSSRNGQNISCRENEEQVSSSNVMVLNDNISLSISTSEGNDVINNGQEYCTRNQNSASSPGRYGRENPNRPSKKQCPNINKNKTFQTSNDRETMLENYIPEISIENKNKASDSNLSEKLNTQTPPWSRKNSNTSSGKEFAQNKCISVTVIPFEEPKNTSEVLELMLEVDREIEKLTKFRQALIMNFLQGSGNVEPSNNECSTINSKKRKKENYKEKLRPKRIKPQNENPSDTLTSVSNIFSNSEMVSTEKSEGGNEKKNDFPDILREDDVIVEKVLSREQKNKEREEEEKKKQIVSCKGDIDILAEGSGTLGKKFDNNKLNDLNINDLNGAVLVCKVVREDNVLITGTDNGKIQYFKLGTQDKPFTVGVSKSAISCLESICIAKKRRVFTGTASEHHLKVLDYKVNMNGKKIILEDSIQTMRREWGYLFIGGSRGFLTRYNWLRDKIEFEDRISEMGIKDLKACKEGARKILIILFEDVTGNHQIHVRDAMSSLHIRTIADIQSVNCLCLKHSFLYFASHQEISIYDFCDGQLIAKIAAPRALPISKMLTIGNLLLVISEDGNIYGYSVKNRELLGSFKCDLISSIVSLQDKIIYGTWSRKLKSLDIPEKMLSVNKT